MQEVQVLKKVVAIIGDDGKIERRYAEEQHGVKRDDGNWIGQPDLRPREISATEAVVLLKLPFSSSEDTATAAQLDAEEKVRALQQRVAQLEQSLDKGDTLLEKADEETGRLRARVAELEAREAAVKAAVS